MDRKIVYPGQIPYETDVLYAYKNAMIGLAKLSSALFGTATQFSGFSVVPDSPASLNVSVGPGEIYALANIDATAYSSLAADTTHNILKQGVSLDSVLKACVAPPTVGQSINYLIQVAFSEVDTDSALLPYYNSSNPALPYSGPGNLGTSQNTTRKCGVTITAKAGAAATTGTQVTPAPDAGFVGVAVVTVANGQTTIVSGNITAYASAPVLNSTLHGLTPAFLVDLLGVKAPQFDNSLKFATTSFLRTAGAQFGGIKSVAAATTLDATYAGQLTILSGTTYAVTLPAASAFPAGGELNLFSIASGAVTLNRAGADTIQPNASGVTSLALSAGDTLTLVSDGVSKWNAVGGTGQLASANAFANSVAAFGYQRLPSGLIVQWDALTTSAAADTTWTYPITYPSGSQPKVFGSAGSAGVQISVNTKSSGTPGTSTLINAFNASSARTASSVFLLAIGY